MWQASCVPAGHGVGFILLRVTGKVVDGRPSSAFVGKLGSGGVLGGGRGRRRRGLSSWRSLGEVTAGAHLGRPHRTATPPGRPLQHHHMVKLIIGTICGVICVPQDDVELIKTYSDYE